ncbi:hypothetical protein L211DRAFT_836896, partial [Terfezia boudieri ATCC MYA-4762]
MKDWDIDNWVRHTSIYFSRRYWVPAAAKLVQRHIEVCKVCQAFSKPNKLQSPGYIPQGGDIFTHWSIDFSGPFPTARAFGRSKDEKAIEGVSIESFGGPPQEEDFNEWFYSSEPEADSEPEVA